MVGMQLTYIFTIILKHLEDSHEPSPIIKEYLAQGKKDSNPVKVFQTWSPEEIEKSKRELNEYLIKMVYDL